jgi:hypothetical protein
MLLVGGVLAAVASTERRFYAQSHLAAWHPSPLPKRRYCYAESEDFERWQARWNARRIGKLSQRR